TRDRGEPVDQAALDARVRTVTAEIVRQQIESGIDVVNDGEVSKVGYSTYVKERLTGFDGEGRLPRIGDMRDFPEFVRRFLSQRAIAELATPACTGPVKWKDKSAVQKDVANFKAALQGVKPADTFLSAASPGVISLFLQNQYYPSHEAYLSALADVMKVEYTAIYKAGFLLQLDCPDLAMGRHIQFVDATLEEFRKMIALHVEALNHAVAGIPPERMRLHLCWGNYEGPHHLDVPIQDILDIVLKARPAGLSFEAANPRHEHEWQVFKKFKQQLANKVLIPGVLDSCTNYIEHPELVAERLVKFAKIVGKENVIAGTDCGFATFVGLLTVDPQITWAKFQAMAEGARLASEQLW
ncbi:MAG: cobalamin-independent methionine synthase II family protein, partial [Candidatus Binatia bacterium]